MSRPDAIKAAQQFEVVYVEEFNPAAVKEFSTKVNACVSSGQPIVPIVIDSYGGQVYSLLAMIDILNTCPIPVATIVRGKAMSCGSVLAVAGTAGYRYMGPESTNMIHQVAAGQRGKVSDFVATEEEMTRLNDRIFSIYDKKAGKQAGYFKHMVKDNENADLFLKAKECQRHGLCDFVRIPSLTVDISAKFEIK